MLEKICPHAFAEKKRRDKASDDDSLSDNSKEWWKLKRMWKMNTKKKSANYLMHFIYLIFSFFIATKSESKQEEKVLSTSRNFLLLHGKREMVICEFKTKLKAHFKMRFTARSFRFFSRKHYEQERKCFSWRPKKRMQSNGENDFIRNLCVCVCASKHVNWRWKYKI